MPDTYVHTELCSKQNSSVVEIWPVYANEGVTLHTMCRGEQREVAIQRTVALTALAGLVRLCALTCIEDIKRTFCSWLYTGQRLAQAGCATTIPRCSESALISFWGPILCLHRRSISKTSSNLWSCIGAAPLGHVFFPQASPSSVQTYHATPVLAVGERHSSSMTKPSVIGLTSHGI